MLTLCGIASNSYDLAEIRSCWFNAHLSDSAVEYNIDGTRVQLPRIKDLLLTENSVPPALYLYARRRFIGVNDDDAQPLLWEATVQDTFRIISEATPLNSSQLRIVDQLILMDPSGTSEKVLNWAKLAVKGLVPYKLAHQPRRQQVYHDICSLVVDNIRSQSYSELFNEYPMGVSLVECWCSDERIPGRVDACFIGNDNILAVYFNINGVCTTLHFLVDYDVIRGELYGEFLLGTCDRALEPAVRCSNMRATHALDFVL